MVRRGAIVALAFACLTVWSATASADALQDFLNRPAPAASEQCREVAGLLQEAQAKAKPFKEAVGRRASGQDFCRVVADYAKAQYALIKAVRAGACVDPPQTIEKTMAQFVRWEKYWKRWCDTGPPLRCGIDVNCDL